MDCATLESHGFPVCAFKQASAINVISIVVMCGAANWSVMHGFVKLLW